MSDRTTCPVVGLVGGVGSGKSTLARRAAERFGVAVVDGDAAGHRALGSPAVQSQIRTRFGDDVFDLSGAIDRRTLAQRVFGPTSEHALAKEALERITHPVIRHDLTQQIARSRAEKRPAVLLDAAVLLEAGWADFCDAIVFVDVPEAERRSRITTSRGWTDEDWQRREASQLSLEEKRRRANAVVTNTSTPDQAVDSLIMAIEECCGVELFEQSPATATLP